MKTKYILLTAALLFCLINSTKAQSDDSVFMQGLQNTLNNSFTINPQGTEFGRLWMLLNSDIRFVMKGPAPEGTRFNFDMGNFQIYHNEDFNDGSVYGTFDWDNQALSMHVKRQGEWVHSYFEIYSKKFFNKNLEWNGIDHYQYMDQDGYWYIPGSREGATAGEYGSYIKFHGQTAMMSLTRTMRGLAEVIERERNAIMSGFANAAGLDSNGLNVLLNHMFGDSSLPEDLESIIDSLVDERFSQMTNMPLFVHWAVLYSPESVRLQTNVTETRLTYRGIPNCLQLTGTQGKYMIFDNYNRLVFINSGPKGGSVEFFYDSDVTVNLPEARMVNVGNPFNRN